MTRQEQVYAGPLLADGEEHYAEIWVQGTTAVVFTRPDSQIALRLHDIDLDCDVETGRLIIFGLDDDDDGHQVTALSAEQILGSAVNSTVEWPDQVPWTGATVRWSQHRVTVSLNGETRVLPGAQVRAYPGELFISVAQSDTDIHAVLPVRAGCGSCGG